MLLFVRLYTTPVLVWTDLWSTNVSLWSRLVKILKTKLTESEGVCFLSDTLNYNMLKGYYRFFFQWHQKHIAYHLSFKHMLNQRCKIRKVWQYITEKCFCCLEPKQRWLEGKKPNELHKMHCVPRLKGPIKCCVCSVLVVSGWEIVTERGGVITEQ